MNKDKNSQATDGAGNQKLQEAILYIAGQCKSTRNFSTTKLYKLLFLADAESYRARKTTITKDGYVKRQFGPVPRRGFSVLGQMDGVLVTMDTRQRLGARGSYEAVVPLPLREADTSVLTVDDLRFLDSVIAKYKQSSAKHLSRMTHEMPVWRWATLNGPMDMDLLQSNVRVDLSPMSLDEKGTALSIWKGQRVS